ncbi:DUF1353 domain-containing protein [Xanthobacter pseudotagetidis]|uniref:DUF1353 domain-containing protein n=1 Tax=Xanthobacter pseudotagetidis TaxID=3119911 RepID=UPI00372C971E
MPEPDVLLQAMVDQRLGGSLPQAPPGWVNRFGGKLVLVLLDNKYAPSIRNGRSLWALHDDLSYRPSNGDDIITVRKGAVTDLTSVPRFAWMLIPPDGPWVKAAVIHDYLYRTRGTGIIWDKPSSHTRPTPYSRAEADWILRDALENRGVGWLKRNIIWAAVRIGGACSWGH